MAPKSFQEQIDQVNQQNPFMRHNGIRAVSLTGSAARVEAAITPDSCNSMGSVHGGLMMAAAEIAAGLLARSDGRQCVTLDSSFHFLRSSTAGAIWAEAGMVKQGRAVSLVRAQVGEVGCDRLLAEGEFTFYTLT